ncbi:YeaC family protein [Aliidiomarina sp. Khilg15.8]
MQHEQLVASMTPELYERLREAVETGRWPDGNALNDQQREDTLALVMLYQARHLDQTEPFSIGKDGNMVQKSKSELRRERTQDIARFNLNTESKTR